ncbi:MAG: peptidase E [Bacteroidota bacterium]
MEKKIFVYGGQLNPEFIKYTAALTNKKKPRICFLPTAMGDNIYFINYWYELCADLDIITSVMKVWINSYDQQQTWEEILTSVDAIIAGGGNTLNMLAIWKAQGIDMALKKAYDQGVVLAGGSAGSICWFEGGTTDSRPKELTLVEGLSFLNYSHCPHYSSEESRRPLYHQNILEGKLNDGYACDDRAGLVFVNGEVLNGVSLNEENHAYFVSLKDGKVTEQLIKPEVI